MHVLITGLNGFTGKYVQSALLAQGHTVSGIMADLMDPRALTEEIAQMNLDAVIHLAGISHVNPNNGDNIYEANLIGSRHLLDALSKQATRLRTVILASSAYVYAPREDTALTEDSPFGPVNDYAVSKLSMEYMAALWKNDLPICVVRPFNYTGIGQSEQFLIPKIVSHFKEKKPVIALGNLEVAREFGDVRDVAVAYCNLVEKPATGSTLNLCTGKAYTLKEVIALCERITGHSLTIEVNPAFVRSSDVRLLRGSPERLQQHIGPWHAHSLEETLTWMLQS